MYAITGDELGHLRVWAVPECRHIFDSGKVHTFFITSILLVVRESDRAVLAVCCGNSSPPKMWDVNGRQLIGGLLRGAGETGDWAAAVVGPTYLPDGAPVYLSGGHDGRIQRWTGSWRPIVPPIDGPGGTITAIAIDPGGKAYVGTDTGALLTLPPEGEERAERHSGIHGASITALAAGPVAGRSTLVSGSEDQTVRILDLETNDRFTIRVGAAVSAIALAPSGIFIASDRGLMLVEYRRPGLANTESPD
jgi:WD40 repeat protein